MNRPLIAPSILFPVLGKMPNGFGPIAWFEDYYKAVDFVNANIGIRTLFIGESRTQDEVLNEAAIARRYRA